MTTKVKENKIAVLAGNFREFNLFAKGDNKYIYADFPDKLYGLELIDVITIGTWYEKENAYDLLDIAKSRIRLTPNKKKGE